MTIDYDERRSVSRALLKVKTDGRAAMDIIADIAGAVGMGDGCTYRDFIDRLSDLIAPEWCAEEIAAHEYRVAANILDWELGDTPRVMALRARAMEYEQMARDRIAAGKYPNPAPRCDRDALLALADEIEGRKIWSCTAERSWSRNVARRIREACGVES